MSRGLLIVVSGPSGVGKGTILSEVLKDPQTNLVYSISMTTREMRQGEEDGVNYYFVSKQRFEEAIANNELLEHAQFVGNYYGTPIKEVDRLRNEGKNVLLEIEVQGAKQVMQRCQDALTIFIMPPSLEVLEQRIRGRKTESEDVIQQRLAKAKQELQEAKNYQYVVCNNKLQQAIDTVSSIIKKESLIRQ